MEPHRRRLFAYVGVVLIGVFGFFRVETAINRMNEADRRDEAERCIAEWDTVLKVRSAIVIPGEAIIEVAGGESDPARIEQFRAAVNRRIEEAYPNPECNLEHARGVLDTIDGR